MKYTEKIFDLITGEESFIEREMTQEELAEYNRIQEQRIKRIADSEAKAEAKAQVLAQLGITEEQAKLLLS